MKSSNLPLPEEAIESMLKRAAELGQMNGFTIDYSAQSIRKVDSVLNEFHAEYSRESYHNEDALYGICLSLGIYLGEYIRIALEDSSTAQWLYGTPADSDSPTAYLKAGQYEVYPVDWIAKQITHGKKESVFQKATMYIKKLHTSVGM